MEGNNGGMFWNIVLGIARRKVECFFQHIIQLFLRLMMTKIMRDYLTQFFRNIFEHSSRDRKERVHMVISTEYTIISRISNHVDDMVHVLLYHTGG